MCILLLKHCNTVIVKILGVLLFVEIKERLRYKES